MTFRPCIFAVRRLMCIKFQNCRHQALKKRPVAVTLYNDSLSCVPMREASGNVSEWTMHSLGGRNLVQLKGSDVKSLLQGLVTNDVTSMGNGCSAIYAMMLNSQGRVLYDLILYDVSKDTKKSHLLMECDAAVTEELVRLIKRYQIRKKVDITDVSGEYRIFSALGSQVHSVDSLSHNNQVIFNGADPRVPGFGRRILTKSSEQLDMDNFEDSGESVYHWNRYIWGIAEGIIDLPPGDCFPLESNLDYMNGVSFNKGCYIGQELTARTHHTGVTRKRLLPVVFDRIPMDIPAGQNVTTEAGKSIGKFRHSAGKHGLGLMRIAEMKEEMKISSQSGAAYTIRAYIPDWWPKTR